MIQIPIEQFAGVSLFSREKFEDERGRFERFISLDMLACTNDAYICFSHNILKGTLRGFHLQEFPNQESKYVSCIKGAIFDVIIDLRRDSTTFLNWACIPMSASDGEILFIPKGFAHAFQVLEDDTIVTYLIQGLRSELSQISISAQDQELAISWPLEISIMSQRDKDGLSLENYLKHHK